MLNVSGFTISNELPYIDVNEDGVLCVEFWWMSDTDCIPAELFNFVDVARGDITEDLPDNKDLSIRVTFAQLIDKIIESDEHGESVPEQLVLDKDAKPKFDLLREELVKMLTKIDSVVYR